MKYLEGNDQSSIPWTVYPIRELIRRPADELSPFSLLGFCDLLSEEGGIYCFFLGDGRMVPNNSPKSSQNGLEMAWTSPFSGMLERRVLGVLFW